MTNLKINDTFPDFELPDHEHIPRRVSDFLRPDVMNKKLGFVDGYPLIVVFYRGFFCPRDGQQMRILVQFQDELAVNYCNLISVAIQPPTVQSAFRAGLGANWKFLCDTDRTVIKQLNILDETEGEYAGVSQPNTFVIRPDRTIHKIYPGWFFVGRPTLEELRQDLRVIMSNLPYYPYEAWNTEDIKQIRIPASEWEKGAQELGASGHPVASGTVSEFNLRTGNGTIQVDETGEDLFFNFTAIPGEGYRRIKPGTRVKFEIVDTRYGRIARNIQETP